MESARWIFWKKPPSISCIYIYLLTEILVSNIYFKANKYSRIQYEIFVKFEKFFLPSLVPNTRENLKSSICSFMFSQLMNMVTAKYEEV